MTREEIKRLAGLAEVPVGITGGNPTWGQIQKFAAMVAAAEREACAEICASEARHYGKIPDLEHFQQGYKDGAAACFNAIRARGAK